jgi:hypothetical protein
VAEWRRTLGNAASVSSTNNAAPLECFSMTDGRRRSAGSIQDEIAQMQEPLEISASPQQAIEGAVMRMTSQGYSVETTTQGGITFARTEEPSIFAGPVLVILGLIPGNIPGIVNFLMSRTTKHTTLVVEEVSGGSRLTLGGDDIHGQRTLREWMDMLPRLGQQYDGTGTKEQL